MPASDSSSCIALVVGAGPVGLTMSLELSRHGVPCRIIDSAAQATDKSKALVLWGRTLELLDQSGSVADDFLPQGILAKAVNIFGNGQRLVHMPFERADTSFPQPLMIPQCDTERLLAARLALRGIHVEREVELIDFTDSGATVEATLRHAGGRTEQVSCRWLLGCDGAHSRVRKTLGIEFTGEFDPNDWILADVHLDGPVPQDELSIYWHSAGIIALFPIGGNRFRVVADQGHAADTAKPADPSLDQVQAMLNARGLEQLRVYDPFWLAGFRIHERKVSQYGAGCVFLAGDAAHIHSPAGGQGMNTGMQDAMNLAWKLALVERGSALRERLLPSYSQERSAVGDMVLRGATNLTRLATLRNPLLQFIRNHAFSLIGSLSAIQERAIGALSEMAVCYPHSPISADDAGDAFDHDIQCGDRLPDADILSRGNAEPRKLLATLGGMDFHLLVLPETGDEQRITTLLASGRKISTQYDGIVQVVLVLPQGTDGLAAGSQPGAGVEVLCDFAGQLRQRLGVRRDGLVLVRPDGYINFRGHADSWGRLDELLGTFLTVRQQG